MKLIFKNFIFSTFAIFFISVSSAAANNLYILYPTAPAEVINCPMDPGTGQLSGNCISNYDFMRGFNLYAITTSPNSQYVYVAGGYGYIFVCSINEVNGSLNRCASNSPSVKNPIGNAMRVAVDPLRNKFYYTDGQALAACKIVESGMYNQCNKLNVDLLQATGIALSQDGNFIYITNRGAASVTICRIANIGLPGACSNNINGQFVALTGITIDPTAQYAYIIDGQSPDGGLKSCRLINGGSTLGECKSYQSAPGFISGATSIALSLDGYYSYISYPIKHAIVKCSMISGEYKYCKATDIKFQFPEALAYR